MNYKTLVLGGSENTERYSNKAIRMLRKHNIEVVSIGNKTGKVLDVEIVKELIDFKNIHTVTLYLSAKNQIAYYYYILSLQPKRIIFNPGTENDALVALATAKNIQCLEACTLVLLTTEQYA